MLVIDRIELHAFHQAQKVREFDREHALRLQQYLEATNEVVQLGNVREDVVRNDQVCGKPLPDQFPGQSAAEKPVDRRDTGFLRHLRDIHCGLDAKSRNFSRYEFFQKVTVVAGNFDDLAALIELVRAADLLNISLRVRHPGVGEGRKIAVIAEYRIRRFECIQLNEQAIGTEERAPKDSAFLPRWCSAARSTSLRMETFPDCKNLP